jgi:hypothetical protein
MLNEQPAACDTETVCPATTTDPVRAGPDAADTWNTAVPFPGPPLLLKVIHDAPLDAVHAQPVPAVTLMPIRSPAAATEIDRGSTA